MSNEYRLSDKYLDFLDKEYVIKQIKEKKLKFVQFTAGLDTAYS